MNLSILKDFVPLILKRLVLSWNYRTYNSFDEARQASTGYESTKLLEHTFSSSVNSTIDSEDFVSLNALRGLMALAGCCHSGSITVLDFGGSLGRAYRQARHLLSAEIKIKWIIVETDALVARAIKEGFASEELIFVNSIEQALHHAKKFDVVYSDGAIQYTHNPFSTLTQLLNLDFTLCMLTRFPLNTTSDKIFFGVQYSKISANGLRLKSSKKPLFEERISYPFTIISKSKFEKIIEQRHEILFKIEEDLYAYPMRVGWFNNYGYILKRAR